MPSSYGSMCKPSWGPDSNLAPYKRKVGTLNPVADRRQSSTVYPLGGKPVEGRAEMPDGRYEHWCDFWGTKPTHLGVPDVEPDLSPTKQLPDTMMVRNDEKQLRHDLDEDLRWFKNHNNKKPQKSEFREQARRSQSVLELQNIQKGALDSSLNRNFNRFDMTSDGKMRPKRLETWGSPMKVWTPRSRPKTPAPVAIRNRLGKTEHIEMPISRDRDANNNVTRKDFEHHVFGFLRSPQKSQLLVKDAKKSAEYDRHSNFKNDRRTHWRKGANPSQSYGEPVTTQMEVGWHASDPETYVPICGKSPAIHDTQMGLPRISLAGGTPGRLNSEMSRFIDNVLLTRPGFNPY